MQNPQIESTFTGIKEKLIGEITQAKLSILVAVAWITDEAIFKLLREKAEEGINVELILADEESQKSLSLVKKKLDFHSLIEVGAKVYYMNLNFTKLMHHKFCVIDFKTLITGSYNWTNK